MIRPPLSCTSLPAHGGQGLLVGFLAVAGCAGTPPQDAKPPPAAPAQAPATVTQPPQTAEAPASLRAIRDPLMIEESNVFFAPGSTAIDASGEATLRRHIDYLKADRKKTVTLAGYTSNTGSRSFNLATTEQRVLAVSRLLRSFGVWARQIRPHSAAREGIPAGCQELACSRMARRVELRISS